MVVPSSSERCIETILVRGVDPDAFIAAVAEETHVADSRVIDKGVDFVQMRLTIRGCPVADLIRTVGLAPRLPFSVHDGGDTWLLLGQERDVAAARGRMDQAGLSVRVLRDLDWSDERLELTDHQRSTLGAAVEAGYYDYPRRMTLTALASHLGVTKSTLCQTLMMVEKKIAAERVRDGGTVARATRR